MIIEEMLAATNPSSGCTCLDKLTFYDDNQSEDLYDVVNFAACSMAAVAVALSRYAGRAERPIHVGQRQAYLWFKSSIKPIGWHLSDPWDELAGNYRAKDRWLRLHTNAPHHRRIVDEMFGHIDRKTLQENLKNQSADHVVESIIRNGGAAAIMMSAEEWAEHPQGIAVAQEELVSWQIHQDPVSIRHMVEVDRPLRGLKVLDLTRIIAGPVATRFLAGFGADILRIDPPDWDEGDHIADMCVGKRCTTLNFHKDADWDILCRLISQADVMIHGYRADALERFGLDEQKIRSLNPSLIGISLNAYGWTGPWRNRRGFDSLVQMSCGIAHAGMVHKQSDRPWPMSVQALDHATGNLIAAAALNGLSHLKEHGQASFARLSLARTAELLKQSKQPEFGAAAPLAEDGDYQRDVENTDWGSLLRLKMGMDIGGLKPYWDRPAVKLHSAEPSFLS